MKLALIVGSVRQSRATPLVAKWVQQTAEKTIGDEADVTVLDLADYHLPVFDEAISPKFNQDRQPEGDVKRWLDDISAADGYIFVTPEYNHSVPGSLKNAVDYIAYEVDKKVATIVAHGGVGGARATEHLRNIASELGLVTTPTAVNVVGYVGMQPIINDDGSLVDAESGAQGTLEAALEQLVWYADALKNARQ